MKVFVSYRRDDTGGRAGRLVDVLAAKYGPQRIFQDVTSAVPGVDFTEHIDAQIHDSDVVLVVIGPKWLSSATADGVRRIDRPDDFVRREVGTALATGKPVVPVLVDGAELPTQEQLPAELAGLPRRQGVSVRDASWHQDVDHLIRQLEGEPAPGTGARRKTAAIVGVAFAALIAGAVVVALSGDDDDPTTDDDSGELTGCPVADEPWTPVEPADEPAVQADWPDAHLVELRIVGGWTRADGDERGVLVALEVTNLTDSVDDTYEDDVYLGIGAIGGLLVDGIDQGDAWCMSVQGDPELEPDERAIASIGWRSLEDPTGAAITLEAFGDQRLAVSRP